MISKKDISIIIVSYHVKDLLCKCIMSIMTHAKNMSYEIIVVDNNSGDNTVNEIKSLFPQITIIENKNNAGFSAANNQGIGIAKGEYLFLLNPDTEITENTLQYLKRFMDEENGCAIVAPQLLNSDLSVQPSAWKNHRVIDLILETCFLHFLYNPLDYPSKKLNTTFHCKTLSGAALFFRKTLTQKIGVLDVFLFWMEDIDFCFRAQKEGYITYLPTTKVIHHSGQSQKKNYNVSISNQLISKLKYFRKHTGTSIVLLANISCFIFIISRILAFSLASPLKKIYRLKAQAYIYTFKRYFRYIFFNDKSIA